VRPPSGGGGRVTAFGLTYSDHDLVVSPTAPGLPDADDPLDNPTECREARSRTAA